MTRVLRLPFAFAMALGLLVAAMAPAAAIHTGDGESHPFANQAFEERWERTDRPVSEGQINRTWMWGPQPHTASLLEEYAESPDGLRQVQYFDKSRMEIIDPTVDTGDLWQVTNGLLVVEMVEGMIQLGDEEFDHSPAPADIPIAGDLDVIPGLTYAKINELDLRLIGGRAEGTLINETIRDDEIVADEAYSQYDVTAQYYVDIEGVDNTVASVFWEFMTSTGLVYQDGNFFEADLFLNPFYATGYPITEAYWSTVMLEGDPTDVLWQCFERRCLTFTPDNPEGWQVESGNVGLHYYMWRYGGEHPATEPIDVALYALGDEGAIGHEFGCGDSLVTIQTDMQQQVTVENQVKVALQTMFRYEHPELSNFFLGKSLFVHTVGVSDGEASIWLVGNPEIGGVCDEPRFFEQIASTAMQFEHVNHVDIYLNGEEWVMGQQ